MVENDREWVERTWRAVEANKRMKYRAGRYRSYVKSVLIEWVKGHRERVIAAWLVASVLVAANCVVPLIHTHTLYLLGLTLSAYTTSLLGTYLKFNLRYLS